MFRLVSPHSLGGLIEFKYVVPYCPKENICSFPFSEGFILWESSCEGHQSIL